MLHDYTELENAIYEAAIIPEKWIGVLQMLSDVGEGRGAVMFSVSQYQSQWQTSPDIRSDMLAFLEGGWATTNTRMVNGMRKKLHLMPRFMSEDDFYDPGEKEKDPFYLNFCLSHDMGAHAGTIVMLPEGDMINFSVEKSLAKGAMTSIALSRLDSLRPHLARSAIMTARLGLEYVRSSVETLRQLGFAAAAVGKNGKVLVANELFQVESSRWTTRFGDRIALKHPASEALLHSALETISSTKGIRSIPLREKNLPVRDVLHVVPVRNLARDVFSNAIAILVLTSAHSKTSSTSILQVLFDLTPAEASLARHIGLGRSIDEIAASELRNKTTMRNQLKSVLHKTGCRRQSELAHLLTSLLTPAQAE